MADAGFTVTVETSIQPPSYIEKQIEREEVKILKKFGAYVRTRARSSIRYRKSFSAPGAPPSAHRRRGGGDSPLKQFLLFAYDPVEHEVVIGPVPFGSIGRSKPVSGTIPGTIEGGGAETVTLKHSTRTANYSPRPYMLPALMKERAKFPPLFANSIGG